MTVAVVCHDSGGAEVVSSYIRQRDMQCAYSLAGPALKIFEKKLGAIEQKPLDEVIAECDWLLCGTSWQSDHERRAIRLAKAHGKRSVAFLDHWTNYRERFECEREVHLPDEIWVGDSTALKMAQSSFPDVCVLLEPNPYFIDLVEELSLTRQLEIRAGASGLKVLYVCEPVAEHALRAYGDERHWGYTEQDALRYFMSNLNVLNEPINKIVIRPHPAELQDKYYWASQEFDLPIFYSRNRSLLEDIVDCDVVVGCASMAMVVGILAKKRVISVIPPGGVACALPQPEIEHLSSLVR